MEDVRLASLLCTRLCHDLIGAAGAVSNGVELLAETSAGFDQEVVELVRVSAGVTTRRLRFFRAAFGVAGTLPLDEAREVADDFLADGKITLDWPEAPPSAAPAAPGPLNQLVLVLVLCAADALPLGGRVTVVLAAGGGALSARVAATGSSIKFGDGARRSLAGEGDAESIGPREVAPYFAARLARAVGGTVAFTEPTPETVAFVATAGAAD